MNKETMETDELIDGRMKPRCPKCGKIIKGMGDVLYCICGYQREKKDGEK